MRTWSWAERIGLVVFTLAVVIGVVQGIAWWAGGLPPVGALLALLAWTQWSRARSARRRRNPSRTENGVALALATLTALIAVTALVREPTAETVVIGVAFLICAVGAVVVVMTGGPPSEPDAEPRRAVDPRRDEV